MNKRQGRYDEAERLLKEALKSKHLQSGDKHPQILPYMLNLVQVHIEQKHYEETEKLLLEACNKPEKAKEWRTKLPKTEAKTE